MSIAINVCLQIESDIVEMMEKALQYADIIVGCSSAHHQLAVQYRTGKIHHRLASLYHNALRNDASFISSSSVFGLDKTIITVNCTADICSEKCAVLSFGLM